MCRTSPPLLFLHLWWHGHTYYPFYHLQLLFSFPKRTLSALVSLFSTLKTFYFHHLLLPYHLLLHIILHYPTWQHFKFIWRVVPLFSFPSLFLQFQARCPNPLQFQHSCSFFSSNFALNEVRACFCLSKLLINELYCCKDMVLCLCKGTEVMLILANYHVINRQWMLLVITLGGCSRRTQWSSSLDWTTTYTILQWLYCY